MVRHSMTSVWQVH